MTKELMQVYTAKITQASKTELIVIIYEIILSDFDSAKTAFIQEDTDTYIKELKHAQRFLNELMATLDYNYKIAFDLMSLYIYVNKEIITAITKINPQTLEAATSILNKLMVGFQEICKQDSSGPMMRNTQQLYAGLTYGKGVLNEVFVDPQEQNRGYRA